MPTTKVSHNFSIQMTNPKSLVTPTLMIVINSFHESSKFADKVILWLSAPIIHTATDMTRVMKDARSSIPNFLIMKARTKYLMIDATTWSARKKYSAQSHASAWIILNQFAYIFSFSFCN